MHNLDHNFKVIAVTETWNSVHKKHLFAFKIMLGYHQYEGMTGETLKSGCGFFIANDLSYFVRRDISKSFHSVSSEFQALWIEIIKKKGPNFVIGSVYRHPRRNDKEFFDYLSGIFTKLQREKKVVIVAGDFNFNLLNHETNMEVDTFLTLMLSNFYQPHILQPTRFADHYKPSLIDKIFINSIEFGTISENLISKISDHMPNFLILDKIDSRTSNHNAKIQTRSYKTFQTDAFINDIYHADLCNITRTMNGVNAKMEKFQLNLVKVIDHHAPVVTISRKKLKQKRKIWITDRILKSISIRNKYYTKFLKTKDGFWYQRYKCYRDMTNRLIRQSKRNYYLSYFNKFKHNSKKFWSGI